uniref:Fibrinogen-related protein 1 n=1 Tax=Physella acuta TaxID=109671 RepID=A0A345BIH2_PHYAT|nr:fibrinogen-related protein 1 [Physella acuta]
MGTLRRFGVFGLFCFFHLAASNPSNVKADPSISASPATIRLGLTQSLSVRCDIPAGWGSIDSVILSQVDGTAVHPLAEITPSIGVISTLAAEDAKVTGALNPAGNYLQVTRSFPQVATSGVYSCEGVGTNSLGKSVSFSVQVRVSTEYASQPEYVNEIITLHKQQQNTAQLLADAYATGNATQHLLDKAARRIRQINDNCEPVVGTGCSDPSLPVGQHVITVTPNDGLGGIKVLCDVRVPGDGWTVFQKRFNGSVDFYEDYAAYENGFGNVDGGEFWLGLKNIRRLLLENNDENTLRIDMTEQGTGFNFTRVYPVFMLGDESGSYTLFLDGYDDGGTGMSANSGARFSTFDKDTSGGCPSSLRIAGWWFETGCGYVNLNGLYGLSGGEASMFWYEIYNHPRHSMSRTEMKFKRRQVPTVHF